MTKSKWADCENYQEFIEYIATNKLNNISLIDSIAWSYGKPEKEILKDIQKERLKRGQNEKSKAGKNTRIETASPEWKAGHSDWAQGWNHLSRTSFTTRQQN